MCFKTCSPVLTFVLGHIRAALISRLWDSELSWDAASLLAVLHDEIDKLGVKPKALMTVLRAQLTGMKVGSLGRV